MNCRLECFGLFFTDPTLCHRIKVENIGFTKMASNLESIPKVYFQDANGNSKYCNER